jgi:GNAT superfamily N-acetyltransferase
MPTTLIPVAFSSELLPLVQDFDCGDEPHEQELAKWIVTEAIPTIDAGGKVWLYATEDKQIVGFGSLGISNWRYPDPQSKRISVAVIPAVAIKKQFWGQPPGPRENRYSSQILDHLILEAAKLPITAPVLGLFVHPANTRAVKLYERAGFVLFSRTYTDPQTQVTYQSMVRILPPPQPTPTPDEGAASPPSAT